MCLDASEARPRILAWPGEEEGAREGVGWVLQAAARRGWCRGAAGLEMEAAMMGILGEKEY